MEIVEMSRSGGAVAEKYQKTWLRSDMATWHIGAASLAGGVQTGIIAVT